MSLIKQCLVGFGALFSLPVLAAATGVYKVPASDYLAEDVFLTADNVELEPEEGGYELRYKFPPELDGSNPRWVRLKSKSAAEPFKLESNEGEPVQASAECESLGSAVSCTIRYVKNSDDVFPINVEAANQYIQSRQLDAFRVSELKGAQQSIMHEAVGVLTIVGSL